MKRVLIFTLVIGLFAVQADAAMWELDNTTALSFTTYTNLTGPPDDIGSLYVYDGPSNIVFGSGPATYGAGSMSGLVGFVGMFTNDGADPTVTAEISYTGSLSLPSSPLYDGITGYFQNDNNSDWSVEMFYFIGATEHKSGFATLAGAGGSTYLTAATANLDLSTVTDIGFRVSAYMDGFHPNPSSPDAFHISVVPVPGAVLLGILGIGVVGLKLRKYA